MVNQLISGSNTGQLINWSTKFNPNMKNGIKSLLVVISIVLIFFSCKQTQHLAKVESANQEISNKKNRSTDEEIQEIIAPYKEQTDKQMNRVLGEFHETLHKAQPESTMGNFCADAIYKMAKDFNGDSIAFAIQNYGGMRLPTIAAGEVTRGKMYELMPFENRMFILDMNGAEVLKLVKHMTNRGGWPISASMRYEIFEGKPIEIKIHGDLLSEDKIYKVAMPDYIANGGDNLDFLIPIKRKETEKLIRKAFMEYIIEHTFAGIQVTPKIDGRISIRNN